MVEIFEVPVHLAKGVWEELHTQIVGAMRYHEAMDAEDLLALVILGHMTMIVAAVDDKITGVFVVRVQGFPRKRVCEVVAVAGKNGATRSWIKEMLSFLEEWAAKLDCDLIAGIGRKGWMVAREYGWQTEQRAILKKDLTDERRRRRNSNEARALGGGTALPAAAIR